jgi:hypothetical protein
MMSGVSVNLGSSVAPPAPLQTHTRDAPAALRASRPGWRDPRLWVGILLVAVSVVAGARLLSSADDTVTVWAAARDMGAGDTVSDGDLVPRRVRFGDSTDLDRYFGADAPVPDDLQLLRGIGEGELLPRTAVGAIAGSSLLQLPVAVDAALVPPSVAAGSVVDLYVLPAGGGNCPAGCAPVLDGVTVISASPVDEGFGGSGQRQLVLGVADEDAQHYFSALAGVESPTVTVIRRG